TGLVDREIAEHHGERPPHGFVRAVLEGFGFLIAFRCLAAIGPHEIAAIVVLDTAGLLDRHIQVVALRLFDRHDLRVAVDREAVDVAGEIDHQLTRRLMVRDKGVLTAWHYSGHDGWLRLSVAGPRPES